MKKYYDAYIEYDVSGGAKTQLLGDFSNYDKLIVGIESDSTDNIVALKLQQKNDWNETSYTDIPTLSTTLAAGSHSDFLQDNEVAGIVALYIDPTATIGTIKIFVKAKTNN